MTESIITFPFITKDTTIEELKAIHHDIWDYAIKRGHKPKTPYVQNCVACEYANAICRFLNVGEYNACLLCPIEWESPFCGFMTSLYSRWREAIGYEKDHLAKKIRDVEWKEDGYFEQ